jgi:hypothetical protein
MTERDSGTRTAGGVGALDDDLSGAGEAPAALRVGHIAGAGLVLRQDHVATAILADPRVARAIAAGRAVKTKAAPVARAAGTGARIAARIAVTAPAPAVGRYVGRFLCGRMLNGVSRTDATFWRKGRRQHPHIAGESHAWSYMPGAQRAAIRFCCGSAVWSTSHLVAPGAVDAVTYSAGAVAVLWGMWGAARWRRTREHRRRYLLPLHHALKDAVGSTATRPEQWLRIPADFKTNPGVPIRIDLPAHFDGGDGNQQHMKTVVKNKLGLASDTVAAFRAEGDKPYVMFTEPKRPPRTVGLAELMPLLTRSRETAPIIGLAAGGTTVVVDLEADSPHVLLSAGSGAGKSVLLRAILAQALAKGAYGIILDVKQVSHMWANNLPNCEYHRSAESIHERLLELLDEVERRNKLVVDNADEAGNTDHIDVGPRIFLLAEEMNATVNKLQRHWRKIKQKGDPNTSPAIEALQELLFMGRQVKIHVIAVAQMASARSMGGPEARENYATRCLARYTNNNWKMLVPEVWPPPKRTKHIGRWQIVKAGVATETQVVYLTPREARDLAMAGQAHPPRPSAPPPATVPDPGWGPAQVVYERDYLEEPPVPGTGQRHGQAPDHRRGQSTPLYAIQGCGASAHEVGEVETERLVGLNEAVTEGIVRGLTLTQLRHGRARDHHFPKPAAHRGQEALYSADQLSRWASNRIRSASDHR